MLKYLVTFDSKSRPVEEVAVLQLKKMRNLKKQWLIHRYILWESSNME